MFRSRTREILSGNFCEIYSSQFVDCVFYRFQPCRPCRRIETSFPRKLADPAIFRFNQIPVTPHPGEIRKILFVVFELHVYEIWCKHVNCIPDRIDRCHAPRTKAHDVEQCAVQRPSRQNRPFDKRFPDCRKTVHVSRVGRFPVHALVIPGNRWSILNHLHIATSPR